MIDLDDIQTKELDISVGGKGVSVKRLGLGASVKLSDSFASGADGKMSAEDIARVVTHGLVYTESSTPVYHESDIPDLLEKDSVPMTAIFQEIIKLSFSAFEEAEKN